MVKLDTGEVVQSEAILNEPEDFKKEIEEILNRFTLYDFKELPEADRGLNEVNRKAGTGLIYCYYMTTRGKVLIYLDQKKKKTKIQFLKEKLTE